MKNLDRIFQSLSDLGVYELEKIQEWIPIRIDELTKQSKEDSHE